MLCGSPYTIAPRRNADLDTLSFHVKSNEGLETIQRLKRLIAQHAKGHKHGALH
jgi:hypothetical protein